MINMYKLGNTPLHQGDTIFSRHHYYPLKAR